MSSFDDKSAPGIDHLDDAAVIRGGATRLARRLRSERPADALSSNNISLLSHLQRHGASARSEIAALEPHQHPEVLEIAVSELVEAGFVALSQEDDDLRYAITAAGHEALAADGRSRDVWLADLLATMGADEVRTLLTASRLMTRIANTAGRHQHVPGSD